jgi:hypothetical protein
MLSSISGDSYPVLLHRYKDLKDEQLDEIEDLCDKCLQGTLQSSALPLVSGLGLGFGIAAFSGMPLCGAIAGAYFVYSAIATAKRKGQEAEYIKDKGIIAHCLPEEDLIHYAEIVGVQAVLDEAKNAYRDGQPMTSAARLLLKEMGETPTRRTVRNFMTELKKLDEVPDEERTPLLDASPVLAIAPATCGYFNAKTGEGSYILDAVMKSPGISRLMIGWQRTGKSYFAAVASRELAARGWKIYHVNLASYGTEDSYYWEHATRSVVGDLASITDESEAKALIERAIDCLNDFWAQENAIMVCDEITYMGSRFGQWEDEVNEFLCLVAGRISALTSSGMKRVKAIWALCPELVSGSLKGPAKAIKSLELMLFAIAPERKVDWQGQEISFSHAVYKQVAYNFDGLSMPTAEQIQLCHDHEIDRICYLNGEWLPVGDLPTLEPPPIPDTPSALARAWGGVNVHEVLALGLAETFFPGSVDPAIALMDEIPDEDRKEALKIAYQWAMERQQSGQEITKSDFLNRAKNDRQSPYLKLNRQQVWDELQALL